MSAVKIGAAEKADILLCPPETLTHLLRRCTFASAAVEFAVGWWDDSLPLGSVCEEVLSAAYLPGDAARMIGEVHAWACGRRPGPKVKGYPVNGWRAGYAWSVLYAAAMRHALADAGGHRYDLESGLPHEAHFLCDVSMLYTHVQSGLGNPDRHEWVLPPVEKEQADAAQ